MRSSFEMTRLIFLCCPAETLQISRLFGVPACVSTFQPNKTSHNQWKNIYLKKNVFFFLIRWYGFDYLKPKHSVIFLVFQWGKGISKRTPKSWLEVQLGCPLHFWDSIQCWKVKSNECMGLVLKKTFRHFIGVSAGQGDFKRELQKVG